MGMVAEEWVSIEHPGREKLALETAKIAIESGVDLNVQNADGRTALDAAQSLKYKSVIAFFIEKGARGTSAPTKLVVIIPSVQATALSLPFSLVDSIS
jgi:ankyrin repeat protein